METSAPPIDTAPSQPEPKIIEHIPTERPKKARGVLSHRGLDKVQDKRVRLSQMQKAKIVEYHVNHPSKKYIILRRNVEFA